jgi:ribose transport system permease protein
MWMTAERALGARAPRDLRRRLPPLPVDPTILALLVAIPVCLFSFRGVAPSMLRTQNLLDILDQMSAISVAAIGTTFVIVAARIDLSIGSTITVASTTSALLTTRHGVPGGVGIVVALAIGAAVGLLNGLLTTKARVNSVIATLGMLIVLAGAAALVVGGETIANLPGSLAYLGSERVFGELPVSVFVLLGVWLAAELTLRATVFGRTCYHVGSNERAARLNGVRVDRWVIAFFVVAGILSALTGIMLMGRLLSANVDIGANLELQAIAIAVIGGASLFGGRGSVTGTILAAALVTVLNNGLTLTDISVYWQITVAGGLIIVAVAADSLRQRRRR